MHKGSCLCGTITFAVLAEPKAVTHCHCKMCQKQHGAAFATYASVKREYLHYLSGEAELTSFQSSDSVVRRFCRKCGSNIEWSSEGEYADWPLAILDTPFKPSKIKVIFAGSRADWLDSSHL
jgi:hypothetical protein